MAMKERGNVFIRRIDSIAGPLLITLLGPTYKARKRRINPKKVLLLKFGPIGDTLLLDGVGKVLRKKYPNLHISFISSVANFDIARKLTWVDEIHTLELTRALENPFYFFSWIRSMRKYSYDLIVDFEQWSYIDSFVVAFLKAKYKVGFKVKGRAKHLPFDFKVPHLREAHEIENFMRLLSILGINTWVKPRFEISESERKSVEHLFDDNSEPLVVFHPGCGGFKGHLREWPMEKYVELGKRLKERYKTLKIYITGSGEERNKALYIKERLGDYAVSVAGDLTLGQSAAVIDRADLFVSGNTGIMHVAASLGTPQIALHGPTDVRRFGPLSENAYIIKSKAACSPCLYLGSEYKDCDGGCMELIEVDEVYDKAVKILDGLIQVLEVKKGTVSFYNPTGDDNGFDEGKGSW